MSASSSTLTIAAIWVSIVVTRAQSSRSICSSVCLSWVVCSRCIFSVRWDPAHSVSSETNFRTPRISLASSQSAFSFDSQVFATLASNTSPHFSEDFSSKVASATNGLDIFFRGSSLGLLSPKESVPTPPSTPSFRSWSKHSGPCMVPSFKTTSVNRWGSCFRL